MNGLDELIAVEEIRQLKARYFRCMDTKDWEGLATIFAADATFDATDSVRDGDRPETLKDKMGDDWNVRGGANIAAFIRRVAEPMQTVHHGHVSEITILSPTTAKGVWPMEDLVREIKDGIMHREFHGWGHYWETYERVDGHWKIKTSRLTRLRVDLVVWPRD